MTASNGSYSNSTAPTITPPNGYNVGIEYGNYVYTASSNNTGATLDPATGVASSATSAGTIVVQVRTAGGTKYDDFDVGTYTVEFVRESITITPPTTLSGNLGGNVDVSLSNSNGYNTAMGTVIYTIKNLGNVIGASISGSVLNLSGATIATANASATIEIEATTQANGYYTGTTTTYNVTVNRQSAPALSFTGPSPEPWGTIVGAVVPSDYNQTEMGALTYSGSATGINVASDGTVTATQSGQVTVTVSIVRGNKYNAGNVGTYTVEFNTVANSYRYLGSSLSGASNLTIADGSRYTLPTASDLKISTASDGSSEVAYNANEMGTLSFEVQSTGGITGINTGSFTGTELAVNPPSSGAGVSGVITIKVILSGGSKYSRTEFTYNVTYQ